MPRCGEVVRVGEQGVSGPPAGEPGRVVQPGVVVALVAPADEQQLAVPEARGRRQLGRAVPAARRARAAVARSIRWSGVASRSGSRGLSGPRSAPADIPSSLATDRRAPDERSRASSCRRGLSRSRASVCSRRPATTGRAGRPARSRSRAAPRSRAISQSCRRTRLGLEERRRPPGRVAHREEVEDEVVVVALERPGRRQDDVGVPGRLVDVEVDRHHGVEAGERLVEPVPRRRRRHRVARDGEQRPHLALARAW